MITITLDTNCLIDVEKKRSDKIRGYDFQDILKILDLHKVRKIDLAVVAASASDIKIDGKEINNFSQFKAWLEELGFSDVTVLRPILYWGLGFWGYALLSGPALIQLDHQIHDILSPSIPYEDPGNKLGEEWKNPKLDVLMIWAHIWNKRDCFITRDTDFFDNSPRLISLGAKEILTPREFLKKYKYPLPI